MWWKQKTTWTGISIIVAALAGFFTDEIELPALVAGILNGFGFIFLRQGVAKGATVMLLLCAVVATSACSVTYHDKRSIFHEGSITNNAGPPAGEELVPIKDEQGKVIGFAAATPSGSGDTATAGGDSSEPTAGGGSRGPGQGDTKTGAMQSSGFIIVSIGQNDGVEQKTDAAMSAAANLSSPGATAQPGTASGGSGGGGGGSGSGSGSADVTKPAAAAKPVEEVVVPPEGGGQ